jgi:hypothetical protein
MHWTIHVMTSSISIGYVPVMDSGIINKWMNELKLYICLSTTYVRLKYSMDSQTEICMLFSDRMQKQREIAGIVNMLIMKTNLCILYFWLSLYETTEYEYAVLILIFNISWMYWRCVKQCLFIFTCKGRNGLTNHHISTSISKHIRDIRLGHWTLV